MRMRPGAGTEAPLAVSPRPPNLFPNEEACARSRGEYAPFDTRMREVVTRTAEAWRGCATGSEVDRLAKVCREHLIQSQDRWEGKPLVLEPWQRRTRKLREYARRRT